MNKEYKINTIFKEELSLTELITTYLLSLMETEQ